MELTEIRLEQFNTIPLQERAAFIRQAVASKAITAEMVGSLFADLIDACGNMRAALDLFIGTNVPEITGDIERRMAGVDAATEAAAAQCQATEATRTLVEELTATLQAAAISQPEPQKVVIDYAPQEVTMRNDVHPKIKARAVPGYAEGGVLFIADGRALIITPDGTITPVAPGESIVNVVAITNSTIYKQLTIAVVPPRIRMTGTGGMRLDANGNIRLT